MAEREDEPGGGDGWDAAMTDLKDCAIWWKRLRRAAEVPADWAQGKSKRNFFSK